MILRKTLLVVLLMICTEVIAKKKHPAEVAREENLPAVTIYVDVIAFGRKDRSAKKMTRMHKQFGDNGYQLVDVSPYTENGDLQGFFVSYISTHKANHKD